MKQIKGISIFDMQIFAMLSMVVDHVTFPFFSKTAPLAIAARCFGRFALPLFAFMLAEGYRHVRDDSDRIIKHVGMLLILTVISEIPFDLMEFSQKTLSIYPLSKVNWEQSVMLTLLLGYVSLIAIDKCWKKYSTYVVFFVIVACLITYWSHSNHCLSGVLLICSLYLYLEHAEKKKYLRRVGELLLLFVFYIPIYHWAKMRLCGMEKFITTFTSIIFFPRYITLLFVPFLLAAYKGQQGYHAPWFKKMYVFFYPAHALIIGILRHIPGM